MGLNQTLYFMSLVGGMAGLSSWALVSLISVALPGREAVWVPDLIAATTLGALIGGLTVGFSDRWSGNRATVRWVVSGTGIGMLAGLTAALMQIPIATNLSERAPLVNRVLAWMLAGSFIGLGLGLRWVTVNRARAGHAFVGGLLGGGVGGLLFAGMGSRIPDLSHALAFVLTGVGICFGIAVAPILLRQGLVRFVSSGDARAQNKFGRSHKEWELEPGDSYVIGSQSPDLGHTRYHPEIGIFIPDAAIAPRHAVLFGREGRFFIARHPDVAHQAGLARYILRVRGSTVANKQELRNSDDILIGRTALEFVANIKPRSQ